MLGDKAKEWIERAFTAPYVNGEWEAALRDLEELQARVTEIEIALADQSAYADWKQKVHALRRKRMLRPKP